MKNKKSFLYLLISILSYIYLEYILQIVNHTYLSIYSLLLSIIYGLLTYILISMFKQKTNYKILLSINIITTIIYIIETIYITIFNKPLILTDITKTNIQALYYYKEIINTIIHTLPVLILLCIPTVILLVLKYIKLYPPQKKLKSSLGYIFITIIITTTSTITLYLNHSTLYQNILYMNDSRYTLQHLGLITTLNLNAKDMILNNNGINHEDIIIEEVENTVLYNPHIEDIPFYELIENEDHKDIKLLHEYFNSITPTSENEYTGMFEGYNLIHITAEAFSPYCISEELTPTLYKLTHSGFIFNNFYVSDTRESTCGGEFMNMTGLLLNKTRTDGLYTIECTKDSYMPYTMGNQFNKLGTQSYAYHNNSVTFYNRYLTIPNLGYAFKASSSGSMSESKARENNLLFDLKTNSWPQSDLDMIDVTINEYINNTPFHAYYMSVSGHSNYSFSGNSMSKKNKELVEDLDLSEACKSYIAAQIEFDKALESLINHLEEHNVLDKTVICFTSDHYPYGLSHSEYEELAGHSIDKDIELYKNTLVLWNNNMDTVIVDKPCSSIDIIPTLSNLFNFEYDSRLITGKDILSDYKSFVYFIETNSFITDNYIYNGRTNKTYDMSYNEIEIDEQILAKDKQYYSNTLTINHLLIQYDYYNILKEYINN